MTHDDRIEIFTDGACKGNPGPGGWGVVLRWRGHEKTCCGGEAHTTNNRMELMAVIEGLSCLKRPSGVKVYTDSKYVQQGISEWLPTWKKRGWRTANGQPVKNADLWQRLEAVAAHHQVEWLWVKGHAGHEDNERADRLANEGLQPFLGHSAAVETANPR